MGRSGSSGLSFVERERLIRAKAVTDTPFLEVVRRHLDPYAIPRQDADPVDTHPPGERAEELVSLRLHTEDPDAEGGIWKCFFHNANELDDIFRQEKKQNKAD